MRKAYWSYINNIISPPPDNSIVHNQKKFWSFIKSLRKDSTGIQILEVDGNQLTTSADKAEALNSQSLQMSLLPAYQTKVLLLILLCLQLRFLLTVLPNNYLI